MGSWLRVGVRGYGCGMVVGEELWSWVELRGSGCGFGVRGYGCGLEMRGEE